MNNKMCYTIKEACEALTMSRPTLTALMRREHDPLPSFRADKKIFIPIGQLTEWMERQTGR